ncbi:MAG TPA: AarF/ABC1/UbiB kinase family protein, partial [Deltaproteobacteria bacterium]|nr:AarF/ABC1/UbiB kinase family protein [Deltaproteobacteria bacterium]
MSGDDPLSFRFRSRARHTRRLVGAAARAGLKRLARHSPLDDLVLGEALVTELDAMKGMAMKIGQILSYMDGALPSETSRALRALQRGVKPAPQEIIEQVLLEELGAPVAERFDRFDPAPIAAASIGQVHRARLDRLEVAVKVQYPGVQETFEGDMGQLHRIARIAGLATHVDGAAIVEDLRARVLEECDYRREAAHIQRFRELLQGTPGIVLPEVIDSHSTARVLTTRWMSGTSLEAFL